MKFQDLEEISIKKDYVNQIVENNKYNEKVISKYYQRLSSEFDSQTVENKILALQNCNSLWLFDKYENQKVKDFKRTNLCKDKFCNNCKKVKQANRMVRFIPHIEKCKENYNLHLLTLTIPNCSGDDLDLAIKKIFKSFYSLNRYLKQEKKIKEIDFSNYGYSGALRSLEITFRGDSYHPHLHCILALDKEFKEDKKIINTYSYSYNKLTRLFSDFEILIQKIWYLLINDIKVTKKSIDDLDEGYSCTLDSVDDSSYYEVFKYMTKSTDETNNVLTYDNFKVLYFSLNRVRQIQGYGIFYNIKDDDSIIDEVDEIYDIIISLLQAKEKPVEVYNAPQDLLLNNEYTLISRKRIYSYLKKL